MDRRGFLKSALLTGAAALPLGRLARSQQTGRKLPNIVFIMADDLGYGDVSCMYEDCRIPTPNIDRIAADGMICTNAHTPSAVCTPTRYGLLTGRYCWRTHKKRGVLMQSNAAPLIEEDRLSVGGLLKGNGYNTAMTGKWHLGMRFGTPELGDPQWTEQTIEGGPLDRGFDRYFGIGGSANFAPYVYIRDRNFTEIPTERVEGARQMFNGPKAPGYEADDVVRRVTDETVQYIHQLSAEPEPFFLYYAMTSPHYPIVPSEPFEGDSGLEGDYGDFVVETDAAVGRVLDALDEAGVAQDTLVIFTADNGCARQANFRQLMRQGHNSSGGMRGAKQHIYEGGHRVPFVVRWPERVKAGSRSDALICLTDFMPACAALVGADLPDDAAEDGYNMLPHLTGAPAACPARPDVVAHSAGGNFALQDERWKLVFARDGGYRKLKSYPNADAWPRHQYDTFQLYDLKNDIREMHNVYDEHPDVVRRMTERMTQYVDRGRSTPGSPQQNWQGQNRWEQINWIPRDEQ
jgi:arylsulfatase A-like enzyme